MSFGLKNTLSEFQNIMNDIFNPFVHFIIVYINDVLVYSNSIDQYFKYLTQFHKIVKLNGIVLSKSKMNLVQTNIKYLGHEIESCLLDQFKELSNFLVNFVMN